MKPQALTNTPSAAGPAHHIDRGDPRYSHGEEFGTAVISESTADTGDSEKQHALSEARGYVLRKYLVDNFPMDDTHLKTLAMGKNPAAGPDGTVEILIYSAPKKPSKAPRIVR